MVVLPGYWNHVIQRHGRLHDAAIAGPGRHRDKSHDGGRDRQKHTDVCGYKDGFNRGLRTGTGFPFPGTFFESHPDRPRIDHVLQLLCDIGLL